MRTIYRGESMKPMAYILHNEKEVLFFLKARFPVYHLSNIFFRDVHYGILTVLREKKMNVGYAEGEMIARAYIRRLEEENVLTKIDGQTWRVNYPEFRTPAVKPAPVAQKPGAVSPRPAPAGPALSPGGAVQQMQPVRPAEARSTAGAVADERPDAP